MHACMHASKHALLHPTLEREVKNKHLEAFLFVAAECSQQALVNKAHHHLLYSLEWGPLEQVHFSSALVDIRLVQGPRRHVNFASGAVVVATVTIKIATSY